MGYVDRAPLLCVRELLARPDTDPAHEMLHFVECEAEESEQTAKLLDLELTLESGSD
jgi:hypothetical protein